VGGYVLGMVVLVSVCLVTFSVVRALTEADGQAVYAVTAVVCLANLYVGAAYVFREMFSRRRFVVANSPNTALFRALDVPAREVLIVYCGFRATAFGVALLAADVCFVLVFAPVLGLPPLGYAAILAVPVATYLATVAAAASSAGRRTRPRPIGRWTVAALGGLSFALGYATGRLVVGPIGEAGLAASFSRGQLSTLVAVLGAGSVVVGGLAATRLVVALRRVARHSFEIQAATRTVPTARRRTRASGPRLVAILHRELAGSWPYSLLRKAGAVLVAVLLASLGLAVSASSVVPLDHLPDRLFTAFHATVFAVFLGTAELVLMVVGPVTLSRQLRFAWENHLSHWHIAAAVLGYALLPVTVFAADAVATLAVWTGVVSLGPLSCAVAVVSGALVAESTLTPRSNVDGTSAPDLVNALVSLVLAAPVLLALSLHSIPGEVLAIVYSACLAGGAVICLGRRIQIWPSTSAT
jgi:hypothetical protein